jgi:hypothetical protein
MSEAVKIFEVILGPRGVATTWQGVIKRPGFRVSITPVGGKTMFDGHPCWKEITSAEAKAPVVPEVAAVAPPIINADVAPVAEAPVAEAPIAEVPEAMFADTEVAGPGSLI